MSPFAKFSIAMLAALCACDPVASGAPEQAPRARAAVAAKPAGPPTMWLRDSTHVHAKPSGDSATPVDDVIAWYERHDYDFIVLTDHNKVTPPPTSTGLVVIPGVELTHNPVRCRPRTHASDQCRIHVNLLGVSARPEGRIEWANRRSRDRIAMYESALVQQRTLGGIAQLNHPNRFWAMSGDHLAELGQRGVALVEIWNKQFERWDRGDATHPSTEALWDQALVRGAPLFAVAVDDAHHYDGGGKYPAGGAWIMVRAERDGASIMRAIAAGDFYASTGAELTRIETVDGHLVVEASAPTTFDFIVNGQRVSSSHGVSARHALPATGYVRAVAWAADGSRAWTQPHRP